MKNDKVHSTWMRGLLVLSLVIFHFSFLSAVETIIVGEVVNETTGEPVPNVNIRFRGSKVGTTSDENGSYVLRVDLHKRLVLVFSAVGYYSQRFEIEPGSMAGLQVALRERVDALSEVVVQPDDAPALELLRRVRAHRSEHDRTLHPERAATLNREQDLYISQINRRHLRRALWKSLQAGMIAGEDSTYILPLYHETQSFRMQGDAVIPANDQMAQALVLSPTDYSSLLGNNGNLNFYSNSVVLMNHAFLSPLAAGGNLYYRYYLADSVVTDRQTSDSTHRAGRTKQYILHFRTRNPFYATFNGEMAIDSATAALRSIQAYVPSEVAVNYVNTIHVRQTLTPDGTIAAEHLSVLLDFAVKTEQTATVFPTLLLTSSLVNPAAQEPYRAQEGPAESEGGQSEGGQSYNADGSTDEGRSEQGQKEQAEGAYAGLDSIPVIRVAKWIATIATTGYIPTGTPVDIGHIQEILQVNQHEGVHLGLPFRTNERLSRVVSLEAAVGYGFRDRKAKGLGRVSVNLPTTRKQVLQFEYRDGYVWSEVDDFDRLLRENSIGSGSFDFTAYAFEALRRDSFCINTAVHQRQLQVHWFADWAPEVESHAYFRAGWLPNNPSPITNNQSPITFNLYPLSYQSLSLITRLSWGEHKYDGYFLRRYAYSGRYPVLYLGFETGHWSYANADAGLYAHLRVMLSHHVHLGMGGTLHYALQAGALFGQAPSCLLWHADANQGYAYDPYRFTLLHGGEMIGDKYVALHAEWNGQGILFNLIPGIRWLHLRELIEGKLAYGYLSSNSASGPTGEDGHIARSYSPHGGHALYAEIGVGIGNILRVCDLYSVWSLVPASSGLSVQQKGSAMWALRFRIHLGL
ncbi:MAG: carboxypeptidase-like regulatory domain-containing protein [Paludibacteraceae bacterium]|nr:carboxypeptidase-like regulatory domain-containing protein [Paludibacteraceae bacterium]